MDANRHDRYWRFNSFEDDSVSDLRKMLADKGSLPKPNITKAKAIAHLHRLESKQICYELCDDDDLLKFATERGMTVKPGQATRRRMLNFLGRADDEFTIPFLEFAPELRSLVYEYYLCDMPEYIDAPAQPPLARTCQLLRREVLPMFYYLCSFNFWIELKRMYKGYSLHVGCLTSSFLETVADKNFAKIRKFKFAVGLNSVCDRGLEREEQVGVTYDVKDGAKTSHFTYILIPEKAVQTFIQGLPEDKDGKQLRKENIEEARRVFEENWSIRGRTQA